MAGRTAKSIDQQQKSEECADATQHSTPDRICHDDREKDQERSDRRQQPIDDLALGRLADDEGLNVSVIKSLVVLPVAIGFHQQQVFRAKPELRAATAEQQHENAHHKEQQDQRPGRHKVMVACPGQATIRRCGVGHKNG